MTFQHFLFAPANYPSLDSCQFLRGPSSGRQQMVTEQNHNLGIWRGGVRGFTYRPAIPEVPETNKFKLVYFRSRSRTNLAKAAEQVSSGGRKINFIRCQPTVICQSRQFKTSFYFFNAVKMQNVISFRRSDWTPPPHFSAAVEPQPRTRSPSRWSSSTKP